MWLEAQLVDGVVDEEHGSARVAEHDVGTLFAECVDHDFRAGQPHRPRSSSAPAPGIAWLRSLPARVAVSKVQELSANACLRSTRDAQSRRKRFYCGRLSDPGGGVKAALPRGRAPRSDPPDGAPRPPPGARSGARAPRRP